MNNYTFMCHMNDVWTGFSLFGRRPSNILQSFKYPSNILQKPNVLHFASNILQMSFKYPSNGHLVLQIFFKVSTRAMPHFAKFACGAKIYLISKLFIMTFVELLHRMKMTPTIFLILTVFTFTRTLYLSNIC